MDESLAALAEASRLLSRLQTESDNEVRIQILANALRLFTRHRVLDARSHRQLVGRLFHDLAYAFKVRGKGDPEDYERAIELYRRAIDVYRGEFPEEWAVARQNLAAAFSSRILGDRGENIEEAIRCYQLALAAISREANPSLWTSVSLNLARALRERRGDDTGEATEAAISHVTAVLAVTSRDQHADTWAEAHLQLALALGERRSGSRVENLEAAIRHFESALTAWTRETRPLRWATAMDYLGIAFRHRSVGCRADNIEKAIACHEATLTVWTRDEARVEWVHVQRDLGEEYLERELGNPSENVERAIEALEAARGAIAADRSPREWVETNVLLGKAHRRRKHGDPAENMAIAISFLEAALELLTPETALVSWLDVQHLLGRMQMERLRGDYADNVERAIAHHEAALRAVTREKHPHEWARIHNDLSNAFGNRVRGLHADNVDRAIAHSQAALSVISRAQSAEAWALLQDNLGAAWSVRRHGSRVANIEQAIRHYTAALTVRTREVLPRQWADTMRNLAVARSKRASTDHEEQLELALDGLHQAMEVTASQGSPADVADLHSNLGAAYMMRRRGDRASNVTSAIAHARAALDILTVEAHSHDYLPCARTLIQALAERGDWPGVLETFEVARRVLRLRTADGLNEAEIGALVESSGPIFADAANAAAELGDLERALGIANESRARILAVRLRLRPTVSSSDGATRGAAIHREIMARERSLNASASNAVLDGLVDAEGILSFAEEFHGWVRDDPEMPADRVESLGSNLDRLRHVLSSRRPELGLATRGSRAEDLARALELRRELSSILAAQDPVAEWSLEGSGIAALLGRSDVALAVPLVTTLGTKILLVTANGGQPRITLVVSSLTSESLQKLLAGDEVGKLGGWFGALAGCFHAKTITPAESGDSAEVEGAADSSDVAFRHWIGTLSTVCRTLWVALAGPVHDALVGLGRGHGSRLVWLPPGHLGALPIGLAEDPRTGRRLGDVHEIVQAPSLEALVMAAAAETEETEASLAIINPRTDLAFASLESTLVAASFGDARTTVLSADSATAAATSRALRRATHWHFATHGAFAWADARQSGVELSNGEKLTVGDLLEAEGLRPPRLVVLSACETGLFELVHQPDEFIGLPATFIAQGATGVVGTLWPVDDLATTLVMARFYELFVRDQLSPPTALRQAQEWLRDTTRIDLVAYVEARLTEVRGANGEWCEEWQAAVLDQFADASGDVARASRQGRIARAIVQELESHGRSGTSSDGGKPQGHRPFVHPYYWGGFIYTGL